MCIESKPPSTVFHCYIFNCVNNLLLLYVYSANVKLYRECGGSVQLSTCTLAADTTDVFAVLDFTVRADNVGVVMAKEQEILSEVKKYDNNYLWYMLHCV